jgi:hypothetical protein
MDLEKAIAILETANASAREAEAEARKSIKFESGKYYMESQKHFDGYPLEGETIKVLKRTEKTITFLWLPVHGTNEDNCTPITRKVHLGNYGEWIQISGKYSPIIFADGLKEEQTAEKKGRV